MAEARSSVSNSPSEIRTFKRLGMASRLKSVTPRGAGHSPQSKRTFGRFGRGSVPVRSVRSVHSMLNRFSRVRLFVTPWIT